MSVLCNIPASMRDAFEQSASNRTQLRQKRTRGCYRCQARLQKPKGHPAGIALVLWTRLATRIAQGSLSPAHSEVSFSSLPTRQLELLWCFGLALARITPGSVETAVDVRHARRWNMGEMRGRAPLCVTAMSFHGATVRARRSPPARGRTRPTKLGGGKAHPPPRFAGSNPGQAGSKPVFDRHGHRHEE